MIKTKDVWLKIHNFGVMIEYSKFTLANGLRVIHNYDPSTAMVALNVLYNVGARDEKEHLTGLAHLFEHLMFGGSVNIPDFDAEMERAGGINNAWTSNDFTNFYDVAPARNFETLLWLESDRMLGLSFSPKALEVQRNVVIEEFKQTHLNRPYGDLTHRLRGLIYTTHPYRYPTIGKEISHIERVTDDDVREFFYHHYAPNNAVLAVSGNVTLEEVKEGVEKWFGDIPSRAISPRLYPAEPPVTSPRHLEVHAKVPQGVIVMAFPMPGYGKEGYIECDLLTDILAAGRSSRFYRNLLLDNDIFTSADSSIIGSEDPGFLMLRAQIADSSPATVRRAEELLLQQAEALATRPDGSCPLGQHEVQRVINRFASDFSFSAMNYLSRAQSLAMAEMHGEDINSIVERYRAVTPERLSDTAKAILDPSHLCELRYLPE